MVTLFEDDWYELPVTTDLFCWLIECVKEFPNLPDRICVIAKNSGYTFQTKVIGRFWTATGGWLDLTYYDRDGCYLDESWKFYYDDQHLIDYVVTLIPLLPLDQSIEAFFFVLDQLKGNQQCHLAQLPRFLQGKISNYWKKENF